jgi:predicted DNA binding CopG/RHH family protein
MAKKVTFGVKPIEQQSASVDEWVDTRSAPGEIADIPESTPAPKEKIKRLTLDIPETLHRAIKGKAASEGVAMVDMLRELLEEKYGNL